MNQVITMFNTYGAASFSKMACQMAPYFSTINPTITVLQEGFYTVEVPFTKEVTNHLGTLHATVLCNAAELAAGMMMMTNVSTPNSSKWIPKGMKVNYLAKAKTDIIEITDCRDIDWTTEDDIQVPVRIIDTEGTEVFTAKIIMNIKAK